MVLDLGAAVVPFVPGGFSTGIKAARAGDYVANFVRWGDDLVDTAKVGVRELGERASGRASQALGAVRGVFRRGGDDAVEAVNSASNTGSFWSRNTVNGRRVYQRDDLINPSLVDGRGRTNLQRMQKGLAPIGPDGKPINLHHMTQGADDALAEVTQTFHQANSSTIHINPSSTPSGIDRPAFDKIRSDYWKARAADFQ